ncbi:MAG: 2,3-bisphosphoglycerate-independent phosphoglycerate mutase [Planctomycetota bacterium]
MSQDSEKVNIKNSSSPVSKKRAVIIIQDGLGDRPVRSLGNKTPLEVANTPNFSKLAKNGICGLMDPVAPGVRVGTDVGHLALFGYDPLKTYCGRGPIEAAGIDLEMKAGDIAFRANFATVTDDLTVVSRRAARIREGTAELASALNGIKLSDGTEVIFKQATEHRAVLILRGDHLSPLVSASDPGPRMEGSKVRKIVPEMQTSRAAVKTAQLAEEFSACAHQILTNHQINIQRKNRGLPPANYVLLRGAGIKRKMRTVTERFNISGACVYAESTIKGIAKLAGFSVITDSSFTANLDTNVQGKMEKALEAMENHDVVVVHYKGPDIAAHDNKPFEKVSFIEKVDAACGYLMSNLRHPDETYIALTSDHATPCEIGEHTADPVPVLISGYGVITDGVENYNERSCGKGALGRITANHFLLSVLDMIDATYRMGC